MKDMRRPPFDDIRVRKARGIFAGPRKMNQTLMYGQYFLHQSYFEDLYSDAHPCPNPKITWTKNRPALC
ncbi:MAG: hypothetical protein R2875_08315 [Desulfobacterales bacterium]